MKTKMPVHTFTHTLARRGFILVAAVSLLVFTACRPNAAQPSAPANQAAAVTERVATITKQLSRNGKLPSALLDAQFVEEKVGDGILGPSDFFAFYALTVPAADIPAWRAALAASPVDKGTEAYAAPKAAAPWWVSKADYQKLELFGPKSLTGRSHGWVKLAPDGRIFIYAFTM
jgi:hypothetical protein